jgi:hypothetical protein
MKRIAWFFDFYIVYFLYNEKKLNRYHRNMINKYGNKYRDRINGKI